MKRITVFFLGLAMAGFAQANLSDYLPEAKLKQQTTALKQVYAGVGLTQQLLHANAEWVNSYGIAYLKTGVFLNDDHEFGAQVGFRYPYYLTGTDQNGYYIGTYAGHLDSVSVDGIRHQRLGAGVDLAYVMLNKERISVWSVGIGAAEKVVGSDGSSEDTEPQIQFAFSFSFDLL